MFVKLKPDLTLAAPDALSFKALGTALNGRPFTESHLEELIRRNVEMLFEGEETLLIVGQQVSNLAGGRSDLIAVDAGGNLVLVEEKRDSSDITARREPFEFQAIRYAASLALLQNPEQVVETLFGPYINRHRSEYEADLKQLTAEELARRKLTEFLEANNASSFNERQRIVLVASSFDQQTLSACAWLAKNGADIRCVKIEPQHLDGAYFLNIQRVLPPTQLDDFLLPLRQPGAGRTAAKRVAGRAEGVDLPRIPELYSRGLLLPNDQLTIRNREGSAAFVKSDRLVLFNGHEMSYLAWGKSVTGWPSINIYDYAVNVRLGKTLGQLREELSSAEVTESPDEPAAAAPRLLADLPVGPPLAPAG